MVDGGYRFKFDRFNKDLLLATELFLELLKANDDSVDKSLKTIDWYIAVLDIIYNIKKKCKIKHFDDDLFGGGCYISSTNEIRLYGRINPITVLHEIRHYIQKHRLGLETVDKEEDARGWSCSLLYQVDKEQFERLMTENKLDFY